MHPTLFRIPFLPDWLADIKSYGVMMMIAFLSGIWLACRRAMRSQANPDTVLNMGFIALVAGVVGARIMYVWHYWDTRFATQGNPYLAIFDIRGGGLEFWGGPLLTIPALFIYLKYIAKVSARWYLDITAPSLAWGLAITRIGCFLNGCCWGATCVDEHDPDRHRAQVPWAVRFPYGSPAMVQQYHFGQLTLPKELIVTIGSGETVPLSKDAIQLALADSGRTSKALQERMDAARKAFDAAKDAEPAARERLKKESDAASKAFLMHSASLVGQVEAQARRYGLTLGQFAELADHYPSKPVHPAQLYETISGLIISWLLSVMFYYRRRHGIVLPWFLILYSISRLLMEAIRQDNPLDVAGLTISQAISLGTLTVGVVALIYIYRALPMVGPGVERFVFPEEQPPARPARA
jgi:phosphatidylglycerol:prolipoprotein diacylglycerol transferase